MFMGSDGGILGIGGPEIVRVAAFLIMSLRLSFILAIIPQNCFVFQPLSIL
jgi:hypothetical protein